MASRVAVLISGRGSNLGALIAAALPGIQIALVVSDRRSAPGLERARAAGIPGLALQDDAFEAELTAALDGAQVDLVCLAGFMRILSPLFVAAWRDRLVNIHPSLLPAFRGLRTHERALAAGAPVHGCSVHLVRPEVDTGPILVQGVVPVLPGDTAPALADRVLELEHVSYPRALGLLASGRFTIEGDRARLADERPGERLLLHPMLRT